MFDFSSWRVRTRLTVGFGVVCVLLVASVVMGLMAMGRMGADLKAVVADHFPRIVAATNLSTQIDVIAIALRNMMLNADAADRERQTQVIAQSHQEVVRLFDTLDKTLPEPKDRALLQQVKEQRALYLAGQEELLGFIRSDQTDQSREYLASKLRPVLASYKASIGALVESEKNAIVTAGTDARDTAVNARNTLIGLGVTALLLAAALGWLTTRSLVRELGGEPRTAADVARAVAGGDFTQPIAVKDGDTTSLMAQLAAMKDGLAQVVSQVRRGSESVAMASSEIAQGNQDLSARTESQASALEETAASMEQLGATVRQNADSAGQANALARSASDVAVRGGEVVGQVVQTMKGINESSQRIADIIGVIDGIAFQTNILALNAAVEAARAGEQGRGFAVVASEVRSLAGRSAEAAKEIKQLISASVERVEQGSAMADQAGETMTEVVQSIRRVTDLMGEINAASSEQASGVAQVGEAVTQMDQATQQNAALVEEMAAAAGSLSSQAQELVQAVAVFKLDASQSGASAYSTPTARPAPKAAPVRMPAPARKPTAFKAAPAKPAALQAPNPPKPVKTASAGAEDDWESF
ncbi:MULTISPECIES: methyl-accepting chemotaxis protein [unclassified Acidovorax]|uniref:methyl-accepting chemotaxis protein n=3 Tax=Acidovorax TaxID=12916 RepID=UPI0025C63F09|nr:MULTISPECIES: methyl-accepting chemotaxis protein [unclassified Acidovorax]HQS21749.1 methyl-accepting chemotaxis protein [Acidovorax defluvii]HQS62374.1 methyl-accepting chemotaxis protein [Acidovorax defluvii]HQT18001.1 methyl-accepting chemotaxis protein [Acidovorax defluvii]HQT50165.1 methyl-accepting chemotaxis protein [Acidovorax defluvii]